jgi:hypothetical protein
MAVDPLATIDVVLAYADTLDPAIDPHASQLDVYKKTRNPKALAFKPGMVPTKFRLQPLAATYVGERLDGMELFPKLVYAFLASCHEIVLPNGDKLVPPVLNDDPIHGIKVATRAWVNMVAARFRLAAIYEMGAVAVERAGGRPDDLGPFDW